MPDQTHPYLLRLSSERVFSLMAAKPILTRLDMELTERCNHSCTHCCINLPADDRAARKRELPTGAIKEVLEEAAVIGCLVVRFTGGEPLLRDDFEELYLHARKIGLKVQLFTNATLMTPSLAALLSRIPPLEKIEITVYGMKKSSYEAVTRSPGSFEAARRGIDLLLDRKVPFVVKGGPLPHDGAEVAAFDRWASTIPWMDEPPPYSLFLDLHHRRDERRSETLRAMRMPPLEGCRFLGRREDMYLEKMKRFCSRFIGPAGDRLFPCGAGEGGCCVDAYGRLQACLLLRHPDTVYDLNRGSLREAMVRFFPELRKTKATHPDYLKRCARCHLKGLCEQCPGKSWIEHGTLDTPVAYFCEIAHAQARGLGLLKEGETAWETEDWRERVREFLGGAPEGAGKGDGS